MARVLGPERLGYFQFIMLLTTVSSTLGSFGVPGAAGKFMAEYLGRGEPGVVRGIFMSALRVQTICAGVITGGALAVLLVFGDSAHRLASSLQILSLLPTMIGQIATQANLANESMRANVPSSIVSNLIFAVLTVVSLVLGWDLVGIAAALLISRTVEMVMRTGTTLIWIRRFPQESLTPALISNMRTFAFQQTYVLLLALLIWNKSDVLFLKLLDTDIRQVAFFSVAFNLIDRAVQLPEIFASAMSTSLLAQHGRDSSRLPDMAADAARYMFLLSMPLLFGLFLISEPLLHVLYGRRYAEAAPVLAIAALLAIVRPLVQPMDAVFRATGRQTRMLLWATMCAFINVLLDWLLIPYMGAQGAATANGSAQSILVAGYWIIGAIWFQTKLDWSSLTRIAVSGLAMAVPVVAITRTLPPVMAVPSAIVSGALVFCVLLRVTRALNLTDADRLSKLSAMTPRLMQPAVRRTVHFLVPTAHSEPALTGA
jgi:O-antigen/teichoic acid export membrane protein